jgi:hypothetical protein
MVFALGNGLSALWGNNPLSLRGCCPWLMGRLPRRDRLDKRSDSLPISIRCRYKVGEGAEWAPELALLVRHRPIFE